MANNPNVGPDPVATEPNHVREKTYKEPATPKPYKDELDELPENTVEDKVREDLPAAVDGIKKRL